MLETKYIDMIEYEYKKHLNGKKPINSLHSVLQFLNGRSWLNEYKILEFERKFCDMSEYNLHSEFNPDRHKEKYIHYLEVIIDKDGKVMYAVPSHQEKLIQMCCKKLNCTREQLNEMCPKECYADFMLWLSKMCGAIAVWGNMTIGYKYTKEQIESLKMLKNKGLYLGEVKE